MAYSKELKSAIIVKMLPPNDTPISKISREEGIPEATLHKWRAEARANGIAVPATAAPAERWTTEDKFLIVIETATMSEIELSEYCRTKGIYPEEVQGWKDACMQANGGVAKEASRLNRELKQKEKENRALEKELLRKEKALAEAAALLVLRKKADAIWGDPEEE